MPLQVALESYSLRASHGAFEWEREQDQTFVVSVWATIIGEPRGDDLSASLDYGLIQTWIDRAFLEMESAHLLEELAARIVDQAKSQTVVSALKIRIEKPEAPLPHSGGLAVVEKTWQRDE
ncbi:MAG: dihydroneopterin aldolase [Candidatus Poseidoniales archaeon]